MVEKKRKSKRKTTRQRVKIQRTLSKRDKKQRRQFKKQSAPASVLRTHEETQILNQIQENFLKANFIKKNCDCENFKNCKHEVKKIKIGISDNREMFYDETLDFNILFDGDNKKFSTLESLNLIKILEENKNEKTENSNFEKNVEEFKKTLKVDFYTNSLKSQYYLENILVEIVDNRYQSVQFLVENDKEKLVKSFMLKKVIENLINSFDKQILLLKFKIADFKDAEEFVKNFSETENVLSFNSTDNTYISKRFINKFSDLIKFKKIEWISDVENNYAFKLNIN